LAIPASRRGGLRAKRSPPIVEATAQIPALAKGRTKGGDLIGMSGQTGDVDAPQIYFENSKGSTPVDPMQLVHGA
jgi:hypothetical protein